MKITVLDGYTCNPGDLSWASFEKFGDFEAFEYTKRADVLERCNKSDIIISNKTAFPREVLEKLDRPKYIGLISTGYNVVDVKAAKELGITVTFVPTYGTEAVAQHTFALILELANHVALHSDAVKNGQWRDYRKFCFWNTPLFELKGKTLGIIGYGRIGRETAKIARAFNMNVIFYSHRDMGEQPDRQVDLDTLLKESDIVSLHCPLNDETKGLINAENLGKMKNTAWLINTARGPSVVDGDLAEALNGGIIAGAGLDVCTKEPPEEDNPLLTAKNCIMTPHIAWAAKETRERLISLAAQNLESYLAGNPVNIAK